jgi:hypothetical protein
VADLRCKGDKTNINKYEMCFNETEQRSMLAEHELNFNCCFSSFRRQGKDMSADFFLIRCIRMSLLTIHDLEIHT